MDLYQHNITIPSVIFKELVVCGGCDEWRLLLRHRAVRKDTYAGLQRMLRHAMNYWPATNSKCWCAIMRSEKTHAGLQRRLRHAMNYGCGSAIVTWIQASKHKNITILNTWIYTNIISQSQALSSKNLWSAVDAMNDGCCCAIVRSEKTHTLACNECFGMQWITGPQRIPSADVPSCGQKRHTRWPATNALACNELRMRYATRTNPWVLPDKKRISMRTCSSMDFETTIRPHKLSINLSIYRPIYLSMYLSISPCIDLCIYRCIYLSLYLSLYLSIYQCNVAWGSVI